MKFNKTCSFIVILGLQLATNIAFANIPGTQLKELREDVEALNRACARGTCRTPYQKREIHNIPAEQMIAFQEFAADLAQVWGDTILEGDYYADGQTRIDSITALYKNGEIFAYRIHYYERAWYTANCDFNSQDLNTLIPCEEGRITESTYLKPDFKAFFRDPSHFVDFVSLNP